MATPPFWQLGVVVSDIDGAMNDLSRALGIEWNDVRDRQFGEWQLRVVLSKQGPPYIELCEGAPGTPWDGAGGARLDHLAYWVDDLSAERRRLEGEDAEVLLDGEAVGLPVNYHVLPSTKLRIEPFSASYRDVMRDNWGLGDMG